MKLLLRILVATLLVTVLQLPTGFAANEKEACPEQRSAAALAKLKSVDQIVSLHAKGACCPSCAIGIRIKISKLDFVDRKRFSKGIDLDPKHALVHVAIKSGESADLPALSKAIKDAGYDPDIAYTLEGGQLITTPLSSK